MGKKLCSHDLSVTNQSLVVLCWWGRQDVCLIRSRHMVNTGGLLALPFKRGLPRESTASRQLTGDEVKPKLQVSY